MQQVPVVLYGSECWRLRKEDERRIYDVAKKIVASDKARPDEE